VPPNAKLSPQAAAGLISQGTPPPAAAPASAATPPAPSPGTPSASGATSAGAASPSPAASATARPPTAPATTAAGATTLDGLLLRFSELAWVQVTQADGRVLLSQNSPAGSEQAISGLAPLRLTVGNASAVTLTYKGRTVDLRPYSRDNVARLTLE
jgi:cytoskeleton protein RodZ